MRLSLSFVLKLPRRIAPKGMGVFHSDKMIRLSILAAAYEASCHSQGHTLGVSVLVDKLPSSRTSRPPSLPLGLDSTDHFVDLGATKLIRQSRML
jgi:hypothetical protein